MENGRGEQAEGTIQSEVSHKHGFATFFIILTILFLCIVGGMYYFAVTGTKPQVVTNVPTVTITPVSSQQASMSSASFTREDEARLTALPPFLFTSHDFLYLWNGKQISKVSSTILGKYDIASDHKHVAWIDATGVDTGYLLSGVQNGWKIIVKDIDTGEQFNIIPPSDTSAKPVIVDFAFIKGDFHQIAYVTQDGNVYQAQDGVSSIMLSPMPEEEGLSEGFSSVESMPNSDLLILNCQGLACNNPVTYNLANHHLTHIGNILSMDSVSHIWLPDGDTIYSFSEFIGGSPGLWVTSLSNNSQRDISLNDPAGIGYHDVAYSGTYGLAGILSVTHMGTSMKTNLPVDGEAIYLLSPDGVIQQTLFANNAKKMGVFDEPSMYELSWVPNSSSLAYRIGHTYIRPEAAHKKDIMATDTYTVNDLWVLDSNKKTSVKVLSNVDSYLWIDE